MVTISKIKENLIIPFSSKCDQLERIFSFFLYESLNINSVHSKLVSDEKINLISIEFEKYLIDKDISHKYYSSNSNFPKDQVLDSKFGLGNESVVKRNSSAFLCFLEGSELPLNSFLRHLRNSIAHGHVYVYRKNDRGRMFILFEDFNSKNKLRSRMLLSLTDLKELHIILTKNN